MKRRPLPDLRNARAGIEPKRLAKADATVKPLGLKITNAAADPTTTELWIYDEIGLWWGISSQDIADALATVTTPNVRVRINSPGGDVFEGIAIMNLLASWNGTVTGVVDALCASIATVIAMACESITMSPGSQMMIHPASGVCFGDESDMLQMAALLGFQTNNIAGLYAGRAGGDQANWLALMSAETWMTADEAVTAGLADATGVVKQSGVSAIPAPDPVDPYDMWDLGVYKFAGRAKAPAPGDKPANNIPALFARHIRVDAEGKWHVIPRNDLQGPIGPAPGLVESPSDPQLTQTGTWEWTLGNGGVSGNCAECDFLADSGPYDDGDQPADPPLHPNCGCVLSWVDDFSPEGDKAVGNHTSSPITAEAEFDTELFRSTLREVFA